LGLLETEVVDLQPGDLTGLPAANDRLGDLVGVDADLSPSVGGPGTQLRREVGHKHQLIRQALGVAGEQRIDQVAGRLWNTWVQQRSRDDHQDGAGLGLANRSWRQQQAEVAVGHPARLQRLAERAGAELVHFRLPPSSRWMLAGSGYPARREC
jgi:hypothetical protein